MNPRVCAGTGACRVSALTAWKTSSLPKKERNYERAAAVSSGSDSRTGLLSLRGLNDAGRTSSNLEGLIVTPLVQGWHLPHVNYSMDGLWREYGHKQGQVVRLWRHSSLFFNLLNTCSPVPQKSNLWLQVSIHHHSSYAEWFV